MHEDQRQEQNPESSDVLFYILAKALSHIMLQVSYSCMREGVSSRLLGTSGHRGVFALVVFVGLLVFFHFMKRPLDPACLTARSWQESWQKCAEGSQQLYFCVQFCEDRRGCHYCYCSWQSALTGKLERTVALLSLKVDGR